MNEHGVVLSLLPAGATDSAGQDKATNGLLQRRWQRGGPQRAVLVAVGNPVGVVGNGHQHRQDGGLVVVRHAVELVHRIRGNAFAQIGRKER